MVIEKTGSVPFNKEDLIRKLTVGILAVATLAAASLLARSRRPVEVEDSGDKTVDVNDLYAAGL